MFSGITSWFSRQVQSLEAAHAEVSWEEALDTAIMKINKIEDIESDYGKEQLAKVVTQLKRAEFLKKSQEDKESATNGVSSLSTNGSGVDAESGHGERSTYKGGVIYELPWEGLPENSALQLTKKVFGLAADTESLLQLKEELRYEFAFDMDQYVILAQILLKMDKNLKKTRRDLVPDLVSEDEFWRNYFYQVELFRSELGLQNSLGREFSNDQIAKKLKNEEIKQEEKIKEDSQPKASP